MHNACIAKPTNSPILDFARKVMRERRLQIKDLAKMLGVSAPEMGRKLNGDSGFSHLQWVQMWKRLGFDETRRSMLENRLGNQGVIRQTPELEGSDELRPSMGEPAVRKGWRMISVEVPAPIAERFEQALLDTPTVDASTLTLAAMASYLALPESVQHRLFEWAHVAALKPSTPADASLAAVRILIASAADSLKERVRSDAKTATPESSAEADRMFRIITDGPRQISPGIVQEMHAWYTPPSKSAKPGAAGAA